MRKHLKKEMCTTENEMEYCVVFRCRGPTFQERFSSIKLVHCPSIFLQQMGCSSFDHFWKGVVDVTTTTPFPESHKELLNDNVSTNSGVLIFLHCVTNRVARISQFSREVLLDRSTEELMVIMSIQNVRWSDEDWTQLFLLSCSIRLNIVEHRKIMADNHPFVAVPIRDVNMLTFKEDIKQRCVIGRNVCYKSANGASRTQRSLLIPESAIAADPIEHDGRWIITMDNKIHKMSAKIVEFLELDAIGGADLEEMMENYFTTADLKRLRGILQELHVRDENEKVSGGAVVFCLSNKRVRAVVQGIKISQRIIILVFFFDTSSAA